MTRHIKEPSIKFTLALHPWHDFNIRSENLWGHWLDQEQGLVSSMNNAFYVPLAVNDTVRGHDRIRHGCGGDCQTGRVCRHNNLF